MIVLHKSRTGEGDYSASTNVSLQIFMRQFERLLPQTLADRYGPKAAIRLAKKMVRKLPLKSDGPQWNGQPASQPASQPACAMRCQLIDVGLVSSTIRLMRWRSVWNWPFCPSEAILSWPTVQLPEGRRG